MILVRSSKPRHFLTRSMSLWDNGRFDAVADSPLLLFGRMHEDSAIEAGLFHPGDHVLCIASGGCTAIALAAQGVRVTALDINPVQVGYVRHRLAGGPVRRGWADRFLAALRCIAGSLGVSGATLRAFLALSDPAEQLRCWRERIEGRAWHFALRCLLHPRVLRCAYAPGWLRSLPPRFDLVLRHRIERAIARHPNANNPYLRNLLLGERDEPPNNAAARQNTTVVCADAADYLECCPCSAFDGFSLSNILDGASAAYRARLIAAVRRAAHRDSVLVLRSFAEARTAAFAEWAARDRSCLWGSVLVSPVAELDDLEVLSCSID